MSAYFPTAMLPISASISSILAACVVADCSACSGVMPAFTYSSASAIVAVVPSFGSNGKLIRAEHDFHAQAVDMAFYPAWPNDRRRYSLTPFQVPGRRADLVIELERAGLGHHDGGHQPNALGSLHVLENFRHSSDSRCSEAVDAEPQSLPRRLIRTIMGGDPYAVAMRHLDERGHSPRPSHRRRRDAAVRIGDAAGGGDLDPVRAALDLFAHHMRESTGAVSLHGTVWPPVGMMTSPAKS